MIKKSEDEGEGAVELKEDDIKPHKSHRRSRSHRKSHETKTKSTKVEGQSQMTMSKSIKEGKSKMTTSKSTMEGKSQVNSSKSTPERKSQMTSNKSSKVEVEVQNEQDFERKSGLSSVCAVQHAPTEKRLANDPLEEGKTRSCSRMESRRGGLVYPTPDWQESLSEHIKLTVTIKKLQDHGVL